MEDTTIVFSPGVIGTIATLSYNDMPTFNIWSVSTLLTECSLRDSKLVISGYNFLNNSDKHRITNMLKEFHKKYNNSIKYVEPCEYCNGTGYTTQTIWSGVGKVTCTSKCNYCNL